MFSIADPVLFQDFHSVFRTDLDDPALLNAVKFTFAFAVTGGNIDHECLSYQNQAISTIRERMRSPEEALSLPTLGAILLLAGVEVGKNMPSQSSHSQIHEKKERVRKGRRRLFETDSVLVSLGSVRHALASPVAHGRHSADTRIE